MNWNNNCEEFIWIWDQTIRLAYWISLNPYKSWVCNLMAPQKHLIVVKSYWLDII